MTFRTQLVSGIGALVLVTMFCGVMAIVTLQVTTRSAERVTSRVVDDIEATHAVRLDAEKLLAMGRSYLLTGNESERRQLATLQGELDRSLKDLRERNRPELLGKVTIVELAATEFEHVIVNAVAQHAILEQDITPYRTKLQEAVDSLTDREEDEVDDVSRHAGRVVRTVGVTTLIGCLGGIAIGIALAVMITRRLSGQYERQEEATRSAMAAAFSRKELLDIVSHDLRSPLGAILIGLELVRETHGDDRTVSLISHSAQRMQRLVNDLLDASRAEIAQLELQLSRWAPRAVLEPTREQFEPLAKAAGITLETDCNAEGEIECDRQRVGQALANLVGNAIKFTRKGDKVVLSCSSTEGAVRFSVADHGPGIPAEEQAQMFEAYRQGSQTSHRGGIGLGLYICKKLVEAHGGRIGVHSSQGQGSTFWIELPRVAPGRKAAA